MKEFSSNDQIEIFEPPVPKARPPIRHINATEEITFSKSYKNLLNKKKMYKTKLQTQEFRNICNNDVEYTDDDDDDDDDDEKNSALDNDEKDYYSDKDNNRLNTSDSFLWESFSTAQNSPATIHLHKRKIHSPSLNRTFNNTNDSFKNKVQNQPAKGFFSEYSTLLFLFLFLIFISIIISVGHLSRQIDSDEVDSDEVNSKAIITETKKIDLAEINNMLDKSIQVIQTRFYNQKSNIWNDISAGIYDVILFPTKPSIIILFGNQTDTLNCLAQLLGQLSGKILGSNDYLILTPKDFPNDVGQVIHNLKVQIIQKKAVIVQDLLSINTEAIKAFHNFCDRENPLVEHAIYIITVNVDGYKTSQKELEFIEKQIFKRLSKYIDKDILDPLVTRLTDGIIVPVLPESNANFNYADCLFSMNNKL